MRILHKQQLRLSQLILIIVAFNTFNENVNFNVTLAIRAFHCEYHAFCG